MARTDPRPNYGSKRRVGENGYVYIWEPSHPLAHADGYVAEHRKVLWDLGALTDPAMHVHHVDHNKSNNDPANLEVVTQSVHTSRHAREDGVVNQYGAWRVQDPACSVAACGRPSRAGGLCSAHYSRLTRHGDVMTSLPVEAGQKFDAMIPVDRDLLASLAHEGMRLPGLARALGVSASTVKARAREWIPDHTFAAGRPSGAYRAWEASRLAELGV